MSRFKTLLVAVFGSFLAVLVLAGTASAATGASLTVGPVPLPSVPAQLCVTQTNLLGGINKCVSTPGAQSLTLTVTVTAANPVVVLTPPTVTRIACPAGTQGAAAKVTTGSAAVAIAAVATVTVNGVPVTIPVTPVVAPPNQTVTVYGCTGVSPGV